MLSFTIDGHEYLFPAGYGGIILRDYIAFMDIVGLPEPTNDPHHVGHDGMIGKRKHSKLQERLKAEAQRLRNARNAAIFADGKHLDQGYMVQFLNFWGKVPLELLSRVSPGDIVAMYVTINNHWVPFHPIEGISTFRHDSRQWTVDYSIEAMTNVPDYQDLHQVMSWLCRDQEGRKESPRYWGNAPLSVVISIMVEIKLRHRVIAAAMGQHIVDKIEEGGSLNG